METHRCALALELEQKDAGNIVEALRVSRGGADIESSSA